MSEHEQWQVTAEAAELYERYPARYILGPWAPLLVEAVALARGERVLDVACGTGLVARIAAQRVGPAGRVVGVDLNPGMIAVARSLPAPIAAPIEWLERSALDLRLPDASFDSVLCQQGLQFFPDKLVALGQMRRVLVHSGRLALSVWIGIGPYHGAVGEALARYVGNAAATKFCASRTVPAREELRSGLQVMRAFPTSRCASVGWISTCPIWINSYCIIWPQHRSHHWSRPQIPRRATRSARPS